MKKHKQIKDFIYHKIHCDQKFPIAMPLAQALLNKLSHSTYLNSDERVLMRNAIQYQEEYNEIE